MSIDFSVYVGPYLRVPECDRNYLDGYSDILCDGRMEAGCDDGDVMYLVPNCNVPGITRKTCFYRDDEYPVVPIDHVETETMAFEAMVAEFLERMPTDQPATIHWGVVPCFS